MGADARGYSWPPFEVGNQAAATHGALSERQIRPLADQLARDLIAVAPWCSQAAFAATVAAWAWSEAQSSLLRRYVDTHGLLGDDGVPIPACALLDRCEARAGRLRSELGLSPRSWAALAATLGSADHEAAARGLDALRAVGRELAEGIAR